LPWQARPTNKKIQVREEAMDLNMPQFSQDLSFGFTSINSLFLLSPCKLLVKSNALAASHYNL
jgi:hypothetical protein